MNDLFSPKKILDGWMIKTIIYIDLWILSPLKLEILQDKQAVMQYIP